MWHKRNDKEFQIKCIKQRVTKGRVNTALVAKFSYIHLDFALRLLLPSCLAHVLHFYNLCNFPARIPVASQNVTPTELR